MSLSGVGKEPAKACAYAGGGGGDGDGYGIEANARAKVTQERPEAACFMFIATMGLQNMWT